MLPSHSDTVIYFVEGDETKRIKIGKTFYGNLERRVKALQTGCSEKLYLVSYIPESNRKVTSTPKAAFTNGSRNRASTASGSP